MTVKRLKPRIVTKPWGRRRLWPSFADPAPDAAPVGEIWFEDDVEHVPELLIKHLFTAESLSIQVHPDDAAARAMGYARGKDEAWVILSAEPGSAIALGTKVSLDQAALGAAARDGSIEALMDWRPVNPGDVFYLPAGVVHAIGAGIVLIEVQQDVDLTYRLYDYGRSRELHIEQAAKVAKAQPFVSGFAPREICRGREILVDGPKFVLERWSDISGGQIDVTAAAGGLFAPVRGEGTLDGEIWRAGEVWAVNGVAHLVAETGSVMLFAYSRAAHEGSLMAL